MKAWSKWSLPFKWLTLSAIITIICVIAGGFILRTLTEREKDLQFMSGPHQHHFNVMDDLAKSGKFTPKEAYEIVELNHGPNVRYKSFLLDQSGEVISANSTDLVPGKNPEDYFRLKLGDDHAVLFEKIERPGRSRSNKRYAQPRGAGVIGLVAVGVSIIVGLGLSVLFLTLYVRKKSRQAEEVISRLKSGDLKARFKVSDVDESSQLMIRFNDMADQIEGLVSSLRETEKARMTMLQELAHDLRTPVASLKQFQEILLYQGHLLDEEKRRQTQALAMKEISYFERLVEDLLFLSGVNDPKYSASFKKVNLNDLVDEEIDHFDSQKITISKNFSDDVSVLGDSHLLKRLLRNALSNAMRFAKSTIQIGLKHEDGKIIITITDDGPGMKESDLKQFGEKKYSRHVDSNISIGLGSVIMKKITSLHDGSLHAANLENGGFELSIKLPEAR